MGPAVLVSAAAGGVVCAVFYLSAALGNLGALILSCLAPLPLLAAGLGGGFRAAALASTVALAIVTLAFASVPDGAVWAIAFALTYLVPVLLVVGQALRSRPGRNGGTEWCPAAPPIMVLTAYGVVLVVGVMVAVSLTGLGAQEAAAARQEIGDALTLVLPAGSNGEAKRLVPVIQRFLPGLLAVVPLVMVVVNAALAQGALMRFGWNRRPAMAMASLALPRWAVLAPVAALAVAAVPGPAREVAANAVVVLALPFFLAGLSVVHAFASTRKGGPLALVAFYSFLLVFQGLLAPLIIGMGVIEQWAGLRRRFVRAGPDQEDMSWK